MDAILTCRRHQRRLGALAMSLVIAAAVLATLAGCGGRSRPTEGVGPPAAIPAQDRTAPAGSPSSARAITPALAITLAQSMVSGHVPAGSTAAWARATLRSPDGQERGRGETRIDDPEAPWTVFLRDAVDEDAEVVIRPGDQVQVELGGGDEEPGARTVVVPDLRLTFDRAKGLLGGQVDAAAAVSTSAVITATIEREPAATAATAPEGTATAAQATEATVTQATTVTPTGAFSLSFGADQLIGGESLRVSASLPEQHLTVHSARRVPYVRVSLHPGDITGAMRPDSEIALELRDAGGGLRASGRARSDADGRFSGWTLLPDGRRARPGPGDRVVVRDAEGEITLDIPPFAAAADLAANRIGGKGAPGAPIDVVLWNPWYPGETANPATEVGEDGGWSVEPSIAIHPASHFYVTEHLPEGDLLYYCYQIPLLYVEPGSPMVEVQTLWEARTELSLARNGRAIARAAGGGPWSGNLRLVLRGIEGADAGKPIAAQPGDVITADFGEGGVQRVDVLPLTAQRDPGIRRITGRAAPGARVGLARAETPISGTLVTAGPDGAFVLDPEPLAEQDAARGPETFEVYSTTDDGHNMRQRFVAPVLTAELGGRTVTGRAQPGARVTLVHHDSDGSLLATTSVTVDPTGLFTATFGADMPPLAAGESVGIQVDDAGTEMLELKAVTAELDITNAVLSGTGPQDGLLDIAVYVGASEVPDRLSSFIGKDGIWTVDLRNPVNGLSAVDLGLIRRIEIVQREENGFAQRLVVGRE